MTAQAALPLQSKRAGAGRAFMLGAAWLSAAFVLFAVGWIVASLGVGIAILMLVPAYPFALWGVVWLIRGVVRCWPSARRAR
jgi:hypothetical protein